MTIALLGLIAYWGLVAPGHRLGWRLVSAAALIVAVVALATSVMHDANHGAFSASRSVNLAAGCSLDVLGGSSCLWRRSHNIVHHPNPNVAGVDVDIAQAPFARLAPMQPWRPWHRYQHVYMWFLYGFVTLKWFVHSDFAAMASGSIGNHRLPRSRRGSLLARVVLGKCVHISWALVLPLYLHPWWGVLGFYFACSWIAGLCLATLFQVAHCVDVAEFPEPDAPRRGPFYVQHQLRTTVNIGGRLPLARDIAHWMMGGLDHQVEHHLAPGLPHTIYPSFKMQVTTLCDDTGAEYRTHPTLVAAVASHGRWLKLMGRRPLASLR